MDTVVVIILLIAGFLFGTMSSVVGIGGGVFFVSTMVLLFLLPINIAVDTSVFIILISSGAGFFTYFKEEKLHIKQVIIFSTFSILGSITSTILFLFVDLDESILKIIFATTILIAGTNMIYKAIKSRRYNPSQEEYENNFVLIDHDYKTNLKKSIPLFILAGFTANLLGIGGGIINTPSLHIILQYPIHNATAISIGIIFFTAIYNTIAKSILGQIDYLIGILIGIGAISGSVFGAKISGKIPKNYLQFIVAAVLMGLAIRMYF
ncbi:MAG: sulfite exporter TauE/SafE family protein [Candidatus Lokiarchaeota archaeon]|nr:sulfite exporter TauE/SafE family protein [Candidatus Lokiarchaeota archaeon]